MRIAVIGAGAIGSVVAAYVTKSGQNVTLVGKPEQVNVISKRGLNVLGARGDEAFKIKMIPRLEQAHDLVIFTVKTQDLQNAIDTNRDFLKSGVLLSTQNGVQADNILKNNFAAERIISSIVMFGATYTKPGAVVFNFDGDWIIGRPFGTNDDNVKMTADALQKAFSVVVVDDITGMKWLKLFVNFYNCIPAIVGKPMQEVFADLDFCRLSILLLREGIEIIQAANIKLVSLPQFPVDRIVSLATMPIEQASGIINKTLTTLSKEPLYGSILQSILRKRTSEIEFINGEVVRLAQEMKWDAPLNRKIVEMVHKVESFKEFMKSEAVKSIFNLNKAKAYDA